MEPTRKRFRPVIDEKSVRGVLDKKRGFRVDMKRPKISRETDIEIVEHLPAGMNVNLRRINQVKVREIKKLENWIRPIKEKRSSEANLETERLNLTKNIESTQTWNRSIKALSNALKPHEPKQTRAVDEI